ncbi:GNAT family N-acetyltransferase [Actinomadura kijaniata]|uniref:GNAT family N-acetyltransferase n=1 Tax=Actinomadura kijaniata TaxID=46161 RepID=UPI00082F01FF|nr:GNAT family N-acetyltransferase [Actinomadura kijaniata]
MNADAEVRSARPADLPLLPPIEVAADAVFRELDIVFPPGPTVIEEVIARTGDEVVVAGDPPVGYAATRPLDDGVYLVQIAVHPDHARRGVGTRILGEVVERAARAGAADVSLLTFRDVPWNGPWYARHGFVELPGDDLPPGLRAQWDAEVAAGLHDLGPRVAMRRPLR